jgi:DNA-binding Lrp family transcriptional regulator
MFLKLFAQQITRRIPLDTTDKAILGIIQSNFPISSHPYADIGNQVGLDENEVLARVQALEEQGVIRRIGANFQSKRLGWHSTLCAAKVPETAMDTFVEKVNAHPGVTHHYLRDHDLNLWFTMIGPSKDEVARTLAAITEQTGIPILNLPAEKLFKIKVDFAMTDENKS